jgi:hypothetical protein
MATLRIERRATRRYPGAEWPALASARLRPGHDVVVVNVSAGGALVETKARLTPGRHVTMRFVGPGACLVAAGHVLRCTVWRLDEPSAVRYRAAVAFDQPLTLSEHRDKPDGYEVPNLDRPRFSESGK